MMLSFQVDASFEDDVRPELSRGRFKKVMEFCDVAYRRSVVMMMCEDGVPEHSSCGVCLRVISISNNPTVSKESPARRIAPNAHKPSGNTQR